MLSHSPRRIYLFVFLLQVLCVSIPIAMVCCQREQRSKPHQYNHELIKAIYQDDTQSALALLAQGADPNTNSLPFQSRNGSDPPTSHTLPALLLALGMRPPSSPDEPMYLTTDHDPVIARALIEKGANVNVQADGFTPLSLSVIHQHELIVLLLDKGADVNAPGGGDTPLFKAVRRNDIDAIHLLIERGANINAINDADLTPLMTAAGRIKHEVSIEVVRALLKHHPALDLRNAEGDTAFSTAKEYGTPEVVKILKQEGAKE